MPPQQQHRRPAPFGEGGRYGYRATERPSGPVPATAEPSAIGETSCWPDMLRTARQSPANRALRERSLAGDDLFRRVVLHGVHPRRDRTGRTGRNTTPSIKQRERAAGQLLPRV